MDGSSPSGSRESPSNLDYAPTASSSPPPRAPARAITTSGKLVLEALQQPQEAFHKDEGGKMNQLLFRVMLQGEITPEVMALAGPDMILPLTATAVFDDGTDASSEQVLAIMGSSENDGPPIPSINLRTRLGGVRYRLTTVSKRLGNRALCVALSIDALPSVDSIVSEPTTVYSKRKNRDQRLEEQARERAELEARAHAAQALLEARSSPPIDPPAAEAHAAQRAHAVQTVLLPYLPPPPSSKPKRTVVPKHFTDPGEDSDDDAQLKKRMRAKSQEATRIRKLEEKVHALEALLEEQNTKMEQIQGTINLYGLGNPRPMGGFPPPPITRSSSQGIVWSFNDPSSGELPSIVSPQPRNQEVDQWSALVNNHANGAANGNDSKRSEPAYHPAAGPRRTPSAMSF